MNEAKKKQAKQAAFKWQKEQTTQYNLRFMNATGVPEALRKATEETGQTAQEYIKTSVVQCLQKDGFLAKGKVVLNMNRQRHKEKLDRLEAYIAQEKKKME